MSRFPPSGRGPPVVALVVVVLLVVLPGTALAAPVQGAHGTVIVESDETVDGIQVVAGTVIVHGTVAGDVQVAAGSLIIDGTVEGDVEAAAGSVTIDGRVDGDLSVGAGSLAIGEDGAIGGMLQAGAGSARIAGSVDGDAAIGAGSIVLASTATFGSDLRYDGELEDRGATVEGSLVRDETLMGGQFGPADPVVPLVVGIYGFLVNLVLGAVLLLAFPDGSRRLAARIVDEPLLTGLYGLVALLGVPIALLFVAITIIGIPLAVVGAILFALAVWVATVYGRYGVGEWLLGYTDIENRWAALVVGLVVVALVARVPFLGNVVQFLVLLLGLGGLVAVAVGRYRRRAPAAESPGDRRQR